MNKAGYPLCLIKAYLIVVLDFLHGFPQPIIEKVHFLVLPRQYW